MTPRSKLLPMAGKHFCVSFADKRDGDWCLLNAQSVMWDNGAFSAYTKGKAPDWNGYYKWLEDRLSHPHWAVVPDVIDGTPENNLELINQWPHRKDCSAVVWHMDEPIDHLLHLLTLGFSKLCFGSSGKYWQVGSESWERRADEAFNAISKEGVMPWIHMLRGLSMSGDKYPFASADSANVARHHNELNICPERMARRIDAVQCPSFWNLKPTQENFFETLKDK
tara:strand:+ start:10054 stop:10725 length:672 start_codon:yes stop_codon:yes gene_type:complete